MTVIVMAEKADSAANVDGELRRRGVDAIQVRFPSCIVFVAAKAKTRAEDKHALENLVGVDRVMEVSEPYQLVHRTFRPEGTRVELGGDVAIGRGQFAVLADLVGDVEAVSLSRIAQGLAHGRATALIATLSEIDEGRGGARRRATIEALEAIRSTTGLRIGIDVLNDSDLSEQAPFADLLRVRGERMQDYRFLRRVGATGKPVVLVRALSGTLEEWLLAAEYIAATGNDQVVLCERGIRSFAPETGRVTLDLASVARLNEMTHLPVIVDPLRSCARVSLGMRLARASVAAGADGIVFPLASDTVAEQPVLGTECLASLLTSLWPILVAEGKRLEGARPAALV